MQQGTPFIVDLGSLPDTPQQFPQQQFPQHSSLSSRRALLGKKTAGTSISDKSLSEIVLRCQLFVGLVLLSLGGLVYFLFFFDTSVATGTGDRVHNIGKMNNQRNYMILSILGPYSGAIGLYMQGKAAKVKGLIFGTNRHVRIPEKMIQKHREAKQQFIQGDPKSIDHFSRLIALPAFIRPVNGPRDFRQAVEQTNVHKIVIFYVGKSLFADYYK